MIELKDIQVTFGKNTPLETKALKAIDLHIEAGEFVTVIGGNGSGKSTLLNTLSGDVIPDQGSIHIDQEETTHRSVAERAALVARVFQDPLAGSCAQLTIAENMSLALRRGRKSTLKSAYQTEDLVFFKHQLARLNLGLENRLHDQMGLLSGGQRQAISLLMSALQPAKLLLLDEHTAALDPKTAAFVMKLSNEIVEQGNLTTLMVTHSMQQALNIGSRTLMLMDGQIVLDVSGQERQKLTTYDLLNLFEKNYELQE